MLEFFLQIIHMNDEHNFACKRAFSEVQERVVIITLSGAGPQIRSCTSFHCNVL